MRNVSSETSSQYLNLEHGRVRYYDAGAGPVLLLLHGSGPGVTGWANYQGNLDFFARHFRCLIVDFPGYGESDPLEGPPIEACIKQVMAVLEKLSIERAHIIGNSLGGIVASHIAARFPEKVHRLVSIGGVGLNIFSAFPGEGLNLLTAFAEDPTRERIEQWLRSMVYDQALVTDALIDQRYQQATDPMTLATTRKIYSREAIGEIASFRRSPAGIESYAYLAAIQAPTLIVWGRDDRVSPMDIALLPMRIIPNCELHIFPDCGHWAMIECKQSFERVVSAFLLSEPQ
ncbi:alpha/beta fold hydrolase [Oceanicoccus sp. KOV_DT_Chl]|uniref:alpha/beta fold hydrolase n=1 Tax=Oceanicoccus sp. KOV_DT_Chl TaxID=1904639 RepID=UPI000C7E26B8|nr:alpha/beta fold hydrolase [Oceanicoccus sp. KOV_DT_Chl]